MADRRTKEDLKAELQMVYEQNDLLKGRVAELEAHVSIDKITKSLTRLHEMVVAQHKGKSDGS